MSSIKEDLITCKVSTPGKVILHGEYSVIYGKTAIAASLGIRTTAKIEENIKNVRCICVNLRNLNLENLTFAYDDIHNNILRKVSDDDCELQVSENFNHDKFLSIISAFLDIYVEKNNAALTDAQMQAITIILYAYCALIKCIPHEFASFDLTVSSDLHVGSGIGSSASYTVSVVGVIFQYIRSKAPLEFVKKMRVYDESISCLNSMDLKKFNKMEQKLICDWAFYGEKICHGKPSGIDNTVCTYGSLIEFKRGSEPKAHPLNLNLRICLVNTKVSRNTKNLIKKFEILKENYPDIVDSIMDALNHIALKALEVLQGIEAHEDSSTQDRFFKELSELFDLNHNLLKTIGASHPLLEKAYNISKELGFSCKLTGAGGGGFAIVLIPPNSDEVNINKLIETLTANGLEAQFTHLGGKGLTVDD